MILGTVDVAGREAHAGKAYLEGRSAVLELAHQIIRLYSFNDYEKGIYYKWRPSPADGPTAWWPERPGGSSAWPGFRKTRTSR